MAQPLCNRASEAGFTLVEVLVATSLVAMVLAALATITSQWLPNWNRGMSHLQAIERTTLAMDRIARDLAAAEYIYVKGERSLVVFEGRSGAVTLVRTVVGANMKAGLERVQLSAVTNTIRSGIIRSTAAFVPELPAVFTATSFSRDPDVLLSGPYELLFSYAGADLTWRDTWRQQRFLPKLTRVAIIDRSRRNSIVSSTVAAINSELPVECLLVKALEECGTDPRLPEDDKVSQISRGPK